MLSEYGRQSNTKLFSSHNRLGEWHNTSQYWPWIGNKTLLEKETGEKYKLIDRSYVRSYNLTQSIMLPIQVIEQGGIIKQIKRHHYIPPKEGSTDLYERFSGKLLGGITNIIIEDKHNSFTAASDGSVKNR